MPVWNKLSEIRRAALKKLREWSGESEPDLYFRVKEFFIEVLGYPIVVA